MNNNPLVSVIVPNYNHAKYLDRRMMSILGQTYENIEVIILDDCSTDSSKVVIGKYADNPKVTQIICNESNSGSVFSQWEKGIRAATGELIWIAESDDYCELNLLEELVKEYFRCEKTVLAYSTTVFVNDEDEHISNKRVFRNQYLTGAKYIKRYLSQADYILNVSCAIFPRHLALELSQEYRSFKGAGDYLFFTELVANGNVAIVNKSLNYCRRHATNVTESRNATGENFIEEMAIFKRIEEITHISNFRRFISYAFHAKRIRNTVFISQEVQNKIWDLWEVKKYSGFCGRFITYLLKAIRLAFNIYL